MEVKRLEVEIPCILAPPFQIRSSSIIRSTILDSAAKAPKSPFISRLSGTPLAGPAVTKAIASVQGYFQEVGNFTTLNPQDAWLPITESRNGNAYYSAFHTLNSGIGAQALVLPLAFAALGWTWGITSLSLAFVWQLYTLWLLIQLHESESGIRYSRYLGLSMAAFGEKVGKLLALLPTMYLSGGTCVTLIMIGGGTMKIFFHVVCRDHTCNVRPLTTIEWYVVFTCVATILAQLPNLNSIAGASLTGAIAAISYCTLIWTISIVKTGTSAGISHHPGVAKLELKQLFSVLNALGVVAFAFRGHNLVLEIQGTMPSSRTRPSRLPMWRGVKFAYTIIAMCLFPLAIVGHWAYGSYVPLKKGMFNALYEYHGHDTPKYALGLISLLVVVHCLSSFQIYAMPVFDNLESRYTSNMNRPCPRWVRTGFRVSFGCLAFFISVALPFLPSLAGLLGGISLPITMAYPCFMWNLIKKPQKQSVICILNWILGALGMVLSVLVITAAIWTIVTVGIDVHFFRPE